MILLHAPVACNSSATKLDFSALAFHCCSVSKINATASVTKSKTLIMFYNGGLQLIIKCHVTCSQASEFVTSVLLHLCKPLTHNYKMKNSLVTKIMLSLQSIVIANNYGKA